MASSRTGRRHYRVAEKETTQAVNQAYIAHKRYMRNMVACSVAFAVLTFVKGLLIGYWFAKNNSEHF